VTGRGGGGADPDRCRDRAGADSDRDVITADGSAEQLRERGQPGGTGRGGTHHLDEPVAQPVDALVDEFRHRQRRDAGGVTDAEQIQRCADLGGRWSRKRVGTLAHQAEDQREQGVLDGDARSADGEVARGGCAG